MLLLLFALFALLLTFDGRCCLEQLVISHQIVVGDIEHIAHIVGVIRREYLGMADGRVWGHGDARTHLFCDLRDLRGGGVQGGRTIYDIFVGLQL
jgi:hypothetical protein